MRIVLLTNSQSNQIALANKISRHFDIVAIVLSRNIPQKKPILKRRMQMSWNSLANRTIGRRFLQAWFELRKRYKKNYPAIPKTETVTVKNINDVQTQEIICKYSPDLVVVSGTNLVGKKIIELSQKSGGIVNLHTGISPYLKGGPNCTNWCLAKNWFHLIGNTVMWIDTGIDTGNIIATEQTKLDGTENLLELHWKVMEHAHNMYVKSLLTIAGKETLPSIPQNEIGEGTLFRSVDWNAKAMLQATMNFDQNYAKYFENEAKHQRCSDNLKLFPLN